MMMVDTLPYTSFSHPTATLSTCAPNAEMDNENKPETEPKLSEDIYALLCELASMPVTATQNEQNTSTDNHAFLAMPICETDASCVIPTPSWTNQMPDMRESPPSDWSFARSNNLSPPPLHHSSSAPNISPAPVDYVAFSWALGETAVPTDVFNFSPLPNVSSYQPPRYPYAHFGACSPVDFMGTDRKMAAPAMTSNMETPFMPRTYSDNSMPLIYCSTDRTRDITGTDARKDSLNHNINPLGSPNSAAEDDFSMSDPHVQASTPSAEALAMGMIKRRRRTNAELKKCYECPWPDCNKTYASDHSRQQHIRIKHTRTHPSVLRRLSSSPDRNALVFRPPTNHMLIPHPPVPGNYQGRRRAHSIGSLSEY